jgi:hypothetical protein
LEPASDTPPTQPEDNRYPLVAPRSVSQIDCEPAMFTLVRIFRLLVGVASLPAQAVAAVRLAQPHGHCDWGYDNYKDGEL